MIKTILLIEDNEIDAFITERVLSRKKIAASIVVKSNGHEGIDYLDELEKRHLPFPEIIFLDLNMPHMDGFAFLELFRTYTRDLIDKTCIVILSSSSDPKDMHRAKRYRNVKEYLVKPLTNDRVERIEKCYADFVSHFELH
jgi:CheY-like chemotaxis protein